MQNGSNNETLEQKISELDIKKSTGGKYIPPSRRNKQTTAEATSSSEITKAPTNSDSYQKTPSNYSKSNTHARSNWDNSAASSGRSYTGNGGHEKSWDLPEERSFPRQGISYSRANRSQEGQRATGRNKFHAPLPRNADQEANLFKKVSGTGIHFDKYGDIPVDISGDNIPKPINSFSESALNALVSENVAFAGYSQATPIQKHAIPIVLEDRDLMACAQTGSGKTAAFLLPILSQLLALGDRVYMEPVVPQARDKATPFALVLAPTRELATQIFDEARKFSYRSWVRPVVIYGGMEPREQLIQLYNGADILIATPGRLVDFMERGKVTLAHLRYFVLDEADCMLDMGFEPDIRRIVTEFDMSSREKHNTLLYSATFPRAIQILAKDFLRPNYIFLAVGKVGSTSETISQRIELVEPSDKRSLLLDVLNAHLTRTAATQNVVGNRILVFAEKKRDVDILEEFLYREGFQATSIHGDRTQAERERALNQFKRGETPILLATAVAARGLDIPHVHQVVIYDFPTDIDDYVHRIGRTGRAGHLGSSIAFFTKENASMAKDLLSILKEASQPIPAWLTEMSRPIFSSSSSFRSGGRGGFQRRGNSSIRFESRDYRQDTPKRPSQPSSSSFSTPKSSYSGSGSSSTFFSNNSATSPKDKTSGSSSSNSSMQKVVSNWEELDKPLGSSSRDPWY